MMTPQAPDRFLRLKDVLKITSLSRSTLYRRVGNGTFPRQVQLSTRSVRWRESAVNEWLKNPMFYSIDDYVRS